MFSRHAARLRADRRENEFSAARYPLKLAQDRHRARRQRDAMRAFHFHLFGRNRPNAPVEIEFRPFGGAQLPGADESQRQQLQRRAGFGRALIVCNGAQQASKSLGLNDRRPMATTGATIAPFSAPVGSVTSPPRTRMIDREGD